ncbi:SusC/RagA family TonB-linked outer membrane protein, partial [Pedobacter sp. HMWF019]|uniref:TonB-dependent receptor n=1 Tax=Pedobacter sp. HMWF019 TaxID=2056856 RepID=UPI000D375B29
TINWRKIMRITVTQLMLAVIFTCVMHAKTVTAQAFLEKSINLSSNNIELSTMLKRIERLTGVKFVYVHNTLENTRLVSRDFKGQTLKSILDQVLKENGIAYEVISGKIVLSKAEDLSLPDIVIKGRVTTVKGETLPGVSIKVKGTSKGAVTDTNGAYSLSAPEGAVLVVSYIGFTTQEVPVNGRTTVNIQLVEEAMNLNEMVVVGYGNRKVNDITGAVTNIKAENSNIGGASTSVDQLIGGRVAGVQFKQNTAQPGGGGRTIIRGRNSLFLNTDPLYVIDGFIVNSPASPSGDSNFSSPDRNPLNTINPNDIESIAILKDAAATAIYGAKGSNGVIIITTKRGAQGKAKITYDGYGGIQTIAKKLEVMDAQQYMTFWNGLGKTNFTESQISNAKTTDWFDDITRTGTLQSHNVNISGATDNLNYFFSTGYFNQDGVVKNSGLERLNGRGNIQYNYKKFNFSANMFATRLVDQNQPTEGGTRNSIIASSIAFAPYQPVRDANGVYSRDPYNDFIANPISLLDINNKLYTDKMNYSVSTKYEVLPGLKPEIRFTYDVQNANRDFYVPSTTAYNGNFTHGGTGSQTSQRSYSYLVDGLLNYEKKFAEKHAFTALLGYEYFYRNTNQFQAQNSGFGVDVTGANNLGSGSAPVVSSNKFDHTDISVFGRVDYTYDDRYMATLTVRRDGSSVFGANNKFGVFPGLSLGWRLDKEDFLKDSKTVNLLKLRAGYGKTGNSGIDPYQSLSKYDLGTNGIIGQAPVVGATLTDYKANPDLKWETTSQLNIGLDYGLFGRVTGAVDFFVKNTKNMLIRVQQNNLSGYTLQWQNAASMRTSGMEFSLNSTNVQNDNFQWTTSANFTLLNNKITDYNTSDPTTIAALNSIGVIKGERTNSYYTYIVNGVDPATGSFAYKDLDGNGVINSNDRMIYGNPDPKFNVGLGNTFRYKNLSLDFFFNGSFGNKLLNQTRAWYTVPGVDDVSNYLSSAMGYWSPSNLTSSIPNNRSNGGASWLYNSAWIEPAWFIRLQSVNLSYNLPVKEMFHHAFSNAKIYVQAQNLFLITKYKGIDPEAANNAYVPATENLPALLPGSTDINAYPSARTFTLGVSLSF